MGFGPFLQNICRRGIAYNRSWRGRGTGGIVPFNGYMLTVPQRTIHTSGILSLREAAVHAIVTLLKNCDRMKKTVLKKLAEADLIPSLLHILREHTYPKKSVTIHDALWALLQMARHSRYRSEICERNGMMIVQRSITDVERPLVELGRRLQRLLSTRSQRLSMVWKSSNKKGQSLRSRIVHKLKRVFKNETDASTSAGNSRQRTSIAHARSQPPERRRQTASHTWAIEEFVVV